MPWRCPSGTASAGGTSGSRPPASRRRRPTNGQVAVVACAIGRRPRRDDAPAGRRDRPAWAHRRAGGLRMWRHAGRVPQAVSDRLASWSRVLRRAWRAAGTAQGPTDASPTCTARRTSPRSRTTTAADGAGAPEPPGGRAPQHVRTTAAALRTLSRSRDEWTPISSGPLPSECPTVRWSWSLAVSSIRMVGDTKKPRLVGG